MILCVVILALLSLLIATERTPEDDGPQTP